MFLDVKEIESHITEPQIHQLLTIEEKQQLKTLYHFDFSNQTEADKETFLFNLRSLMIPTIYSDNFHHRDTHTITSLLIQHDDEKYSIFPLYLDAKDNFTEQSLKNLTQVMQADVVYPIVTSIAIAKDNCRIFDDTEYKKDVANSIQKRFNLHLESIFDYYHNHNQTIPFSDYKNYFEISHNFINTNLGSTVPFVSKENDKYINSSHFFNLYSEYSHIPNKTVLDTQSKYHLLLNFNLSHIPYDELTDSEEVLNSFVEPLNYLYLDVLENFLADLNQLNQQYAGSLSNETYIQLKTDIFEKTLDILDSFNCDTGFYFDFYNNLSNYLLIEPQSFAKTIKKEQIQLESSNKDDYATYYSRLNSFNSKHNTLLIRNNFDIFLKIIQSANEYKHSSVDLIAPPPMFALTSDQKLQRLKHFDYSQGMNDDSILNNFNQENKDLSPHPNKHIITHILNDNLVVNRLLTNHSMISICHNIMDNFDNQMASQFDNIKLTNLKMLFESDIEKLSIFYHTDKPISSTDKNHLNEYLFKCFLSSRKNISLVKFKDFILNDLDWQNLEYNDLKILSNQKVEHHTIENAVREVSLHQKFQANDVKQNKIIPKRKI